LQIANQQLQIALRIAGLLTRIHELRNLQSPVCNLHFAINRSMSKPSELREMNDEQLQAELQQTRQELFRLRFQAATEKLDAPSNLTKLRREVARIRTIQRERELAAAK
jgi:large subunit ribosomal protein L29